MAERLGVAKVLPLVVARVQVRVVQPAGARVAARLVVAQASLVVALAGVVRAVQQAEARAGHVPPVRVVSPGDQTVVLLVDLVVALALLALPVELRAQLSRLERLEPLALLLARPAWREPLRAAQVLPDPTSSTRM